MIAMASVTAAPPVPGPAGVSGPEPVHLPGRLRAFTTLARRRFALSAHTPREIAVPLVTPILFADVIAPALARTMGRGGPGGLDYLSFVAIGTVGLLVPLSTVLGGIGMIVDRDSGAQRDLLAAPVPRAMMILGNLAVAVTVASLQVVALLVAAVLRGADFHVTATGAAWFVAATLALAVAMHGAAETLASRIPKQEEYVGAAPPVALVPWFFAGSFFPISAMPAGLTAFAKVLPLTHALALMRYGLIDRNGTGLHDIWGMTNTTVMAALSLAVVVVSAALLLQLAVRSFSRAAVH
jgi:ABC-2 type transport system permease protein